MADLFYRILGAIGYGHPVHPVLTHLVIGPVIAAFIFELIALIWKKPIFRKTAWHLTVLAFVFWFITVSVGLIDWAHFYHDAMLPEIKAKLILAGILFLLLLANIIVHKRVPEESLIPTIHITFAMACVVLLGYFGGNLVYGAKPTAGGAAEQSSNSEGFQETTSNGFTLGWKIDGSNLDVRLSYPTTGWIGVGFGQTGTMEGSDIFIGYVGGDGKPVVVDSFGVGPEHHEADTAVGGQDNVTNVAGSVSNGTTSLSFTIPLDSGDPNDVVYRAGSTYRVILAHAPDGAADEETYHGYDSRFVIQIAL